MMRKRNSKRDAPAENAPTAASSRNNEDILQAKNHKLAKELSECRVRQREEAKNVSRLTMENMNLASRCREAIAQAAALKKELSVQKKKTAEAVHQTHQLISQVKKMSPERPPPPKPPQLVMVTPDVTMSFTPPQDDSEHKEDDVQIVHSHEDGVPEESSTEEKKTDDVTTSDVSPKSLPPPAQPKVQDEPMHKPDAPASSEEDLEETDTVPETIPEKPAFPVTASPMMSRKSHNDSYDEEYPEGPAMGVVTKKPASSLLSSIDAFEASFSTNFPESFSPKDEDSSKSGLYNPFDTTSPTKSDPPSSLTPPKTLSPKAISSISPKAVTTSLSPKHIPPPLNLKVVNTSATAVSTLSPTNSTHRKNGVVTTPNGLETSPRDTPPRKLTRQQEEKASLLVKALPLSLNMVELHHDEMVPSSPDSPDIEVLSPNGQTRITPVMTPSTSSRFTATSSNEARSADVPEDETFSSRMRSRRVGPTSELNKAATSFPTSELNKPATRFKKSFAVDVATRPTRGAPLSSRSNGSTEASPPLKNNLDSASRFQRATRTFNHVGTAAAKVRELKARDRSVSAPRVRTPPSLTFSENPERPQKLAGYSTARARYERAIQSPKDVSDIPMDGRQRRNVNLSNRRRADFGNGASPLVSSPKSLTTK